MAWLHAWLGLLLGGLLYFMFVTGTLGYLDSAIDRWMRPELPAARYPLPPEPALRQAQAFLQTHAHEARRWSITLPIDRNEPYLRVAWQGEAGSGAAYLDPGSGHQIATRATGGGQTLYQLHWRLHYLPARASEWIVGLASFVLLIALVTGVIVHRRIFADFFTFRPRKGQRSWLDAHNLAGVVSLPFQLMITYSGLVFVMFTLMPLIPAAWYGAGNSGQQAFLNEVFPPLAPAQAARRRAALAPLEQLLPDVRAQWGAAPVASIDIQDPHDASARILVVGDFAAGPLRAANILAYDGVSGARLAQRPAWQSAPKALRDLLLGLHEGLFAPPVLRALYVLSGLLGAAMIATGMVLWTVKRRQRGDRHAGLALVERLNVAVIMGLPVAIAAYFWANRLLPLDLERRADWEVHALFLAWLLMFAWAALRPARRAWREQALLAAALCAALPLLNALTSAQHLGRALAQQDLAMAGFDLAALAAGALFAGMARALARRQALSG
ncbi:MAG: PepSY-associated TM helix domain-containing protein [Comamonas sp.]